MGANVLTAAFALKSETVHDYCGTGCGLIACTNRGQTTFIAARSADSLRAGQAVKGLRHATNEPA